MMQNIDDIQTQAKETMEMATQNLSSVSKSVQAIATETADYAKKSYEDGTQAAEKVFGAKSFDKFMEAQSEYAKNAYEAHVSEMNKLGEMFMDLSKTMYSPVETALARVNK
ncbi:MAG: phasin family protein [Hyphomicrobiales bacterium]